MKKIIYFLICILFLTETSLVYAKDKCSLKVNTLGLGQIVVVKEDEKIEFDDEHPKQSHHENAKEGTKFKVGAKAEGGYIFTKWMLDGKDYSEDEIIIVEVNKDMELIAVFEVDENYEEEITATSSKPQKPSIKNSESPYIILGTSTLLALSAAIVALKKKKMMN